MVHPAEYIKRSVLAHCVNNFYCERENPQPNEQREIAMGTRRTERAGTEKVTGVRVGKRVS